MPSLVWPCTRPVLAASAIYFMFMIGLYDFSYWMPTLIKTLTHFSNQKAAMVAAIPYPLAIVAMIPIGRHSDHRGERRWHIAGCALATAVGFAWTPYCHSAITVLAACRWRPSVCGAWTAVLGVTGRFSSRHGGGGGHCCDQLDRLPGRFCRSVSCRIIDDAHGGFGGRNAFRLCRGVCRRTFGSEPQHAGRAEIEVMMSRACIVVALI